MKKLSLTLVLLLGTLCFTFAQRIVTGNVSDEKGEGLIGANVLVRGTSFGTVTDLDGNFNLSVPDDGTSLMISYTGYQTMITDIADKSLVNIVLLEGQLLGEVVVTALNIEREEKSLGYAVQEVSGESISEAREGNLVNALSGKVAGLQVTNSQTMGGSANVTIRGTSSLTGNNQALFVVDGVPLDNSVFNVDAQDEGSGGYDYGNLAGDINPDDVASISVLKGAAATALYGSRAANGVILVTTKRGKARDGIGISFISSATVNKINKSTGPQHQREYGAGYGAYYEDATSYFFEGDVDGDGQLDLIVPTSEDASWGARFDPNLNVVHWDALDPFADNYGEKRPYIAPANDYTAFFETGLTLKNSIAIDGGTEKTTVRLSYSNDNTKGILPNSELQKHTIGFTGSQQLTTKLKATLSGNYVNNSATGRGGTGYDALNVMQSFGQWFQANVDVKRLENSYLTPDGRHQSWNSTYWDNSTPIYFDNPYFIRKESYQTDRRNRMFGNVLLEYELTDFLTIQGRAATDLFNDLQEERIAQQSVEISDYTKRLREKTETNLELLLKFNKRLGDNISLNGLLGGNRRKDQFEYTLLSTRDGLVIDKLYTVNNSVSSELQRDDVLNRKEQRSVFGQVSLGFSDFFYVDVSARNDWSSTLPKANNSYFYPAASASFVFSELFETATNSLLSFGKVRFNYAEVGNDTDPYRTSLTYVQNNNFGNNPAFSVPSELYNADLRPELTKSYEAGIEVNFLNNRYGVDLSVYKTNTFDQILPVEVSRASGYTTKLINAGNIENKGIEIELFANPVRTKNFSWNIGGNWSKNQNTVVELAPDVDNILLGDHFFMTYNAAVGEPYGTFKGTNYVFHENGEPMVDEDGFYMSTLSNTEILGNSNPDWIAGLYNDFNIFGFRLHTLLDFQQGGSVYSLNTMFGRATGLYEETAGLNAQGNPKRDPVAEGGGVLLDGVMEDGSPNTTYIDASNFFGAWYYRNNPVGVYIFDASYIKLREASLSYSLSPSVVGNTPFTNMTISLVGRNLAILKKNVKHFDPEQALSAGNVQGFEVGSYPTLRSFGLSVKLGL